MYLIFDLETQIHQSHKRKANPWHPENYVVMRGWKKQGDTQAQRSTHASRKDNWLVIDDDVTVLAGHNIKFDLLYEMVAGNPYLKAFFKRGGRIWDTQYAEYLLQAQDRKYHMNAMDDIAESYGGRKKIDQIKAMWAAGIQTSEIDPGLLEDYLIGTEEEQRNSGDIGNTEKIYLGQVKAAKEQGMYKAILHRMEGLAATTEMEFNGIKVDREKAAVNLKKLEVLHAEVSKRLHEHVADMPDGLVFNWGSNIQCSCLIFGGTIKYSKQDTYIDDATGELARYKATERWPVFNGKERKPGKYAGGAEIAERGGMYWLTRPGKPDVQQDTYKSGKKAGEPKCKNVQVPGELKVKYQDFFHKLPGYTKPDPDWVGKQTDGAGDPIYSTNSDVIERISKRGIPFLEDMGKLQALDKEIGTYYMRYDEKKKDWVGMLTCVGDDGVVHHSLNHTSTVTTRLSANNPNAQNFPRGDKSELKAIFVSRFGDEGCMIEADYSQLEVVVQGLLSRDKNLITDLQNKIDFHCKRVAAKYGCTYEEALIWCKDEDNSPDYKLWKGRRTGVKEFSFQRAYGAGAAAISDATGLDIEVVKELIEAEDKMYPGITRFNDKVERSANATSEPFRAGQDEGYRMYRKGFWQSPTGTMYSWRTHDAPSFLRRKGIVDSFSPPELKNYPVQGTGGEIVQMIIGRLWRYFVKKNNWDGKALLVNTVHDCVWVDAHLSVRDEVARAVKTIMESVPQLLESQFGINCPVPFPVEVEAGPNMLSLKHI